MGYWVFLSVRPRSHYCPNQKFYVTSLKISQSLAFNRLVSSRLKILTTCTQDFFSSCVTIVCVTNRNPLPLSLSLSPPPPSSLPIPNSMIHTLALWRVDRVSNNLSEVWIPVGNHFMWSFRVQVASHPFLFTKTAQVNKLGAIFNLNNCREIHQLKRVTPHEFTYITVDKQVHEICK